MKLITKSILITAGVTYAAFSALAIGMSLNPSAPQSAPQVKAATTESLDSVRERRERHLAAMTPAAPAVSAEAQAALNRSRELLPQVSQLMSNVKAYADQNDFVSACASIQPAASGYTEMAGLFPQLPADAQQAAKAPMVQVGESIAASLKICEQYGL